MPSIPELLKEHITLVVECLDRLYLNGYRVAGDIGRAGDKRKIAYEALDNGFLSCAAPDQLQQMCDSLGPEQIERVFQRKS
jgi:hypothetical protein